MKFFRHILSIGFILSTAIGCKVGQPYVRPDLGSVDSYYGGNQLDSAAIDRSNLADVNWRDYFKDSTLITLIDTALVNNLDLARQAKRVEIGEAGLPPVQRQFFPGPGTLTP